MAGGGPVGSLDAGRGFALSEPEAFQAGVHRAHMEGGRGRRRREKFRRRQRMGGGRTKKADRLGLRSRISFNAAWVRAGEKRTWPDWAGGTGTGLGVRYLFWRL